MLGSRHAGSSVTWAVSAAPKHPGMWGNKRLGHTQGHRSQPEHAIARPHLRPGWMTGARHTAGIAHGWPALPWPCFGAEAAVGCTCASVSLRAVYPERCASGTRMLTSSVQWWRMTVRHLDTSIVKFFRRSRRSRWCGTCGSARFG
jgi:hypothetical protein